MTHSLKCLGTSWYRTPMKYILKLKLEHNVNISGNVNIFISFQDGKWHVILQCTWLLSWALDSLVSRPSFGFWFWHKIICNQ